MPTMQTIQWQQGEVVSPHIDQPVKVVIAKDIAYVANANRLQNLNIYLPMTLEYTKLVGQPVISLPVTSSQSSLPYRQVHIHGGAWRDPQLTSTSIEAAVAHAFFAKDTPHSITAIISINYTVSPFPTHPTLPYDLTKDKGTDPAREAVHPMHVHDILHAFALLRKLGLEDESYILTGHSAGACLAAQSTLQSPRYWDFDSLPDPPRPAALLGMNGLYDLPGLVHDLGPSHVHLSDVYANLQNIAFGANESNWASASPARVNPAELTNRVQEGKAPRLVMLDQSVEDQLVPLNQTEKLQAVLTQVPEIRVLRGRRCTGKHAAPWEQGYMIWQNVQDILELLANEK